MHRNQLLITINRIIACKESYNVLYMRYSRVSTFVYGGIKRPQHTCRHLM